MSQGSISLAPRRGGIELRLRSEPLERFWTETEGERRQVAFSEVESIAPDKFHRPIGSQHPLSNMLRDHGGYGDNDALFDDLLQPNMTALRLKGTGNGVREVFPYAQPCSSHALGDWLSRATARVRLIHGWQSPLPQVERLRRIARIGVELEGGWDRNVDRVARRHGAQVKTDSSVEARGDFLSGGEIVSAPMIGLEPMEEFMRDLYPDDVDRSCGMHVHVSFHETGDYALVMEPEFLGSLYASLDRWGRDTLRSPTHRFWSRLRGGNEYCRANAIDNPEAAMMGSASRYAYVNFASWQIRQTVEFRGLPMFNDTETAIAAVRTLVLTVESYLRRQGTGKGTISATLGS